MKLEQKQLIIFLTFIAIVVAYVVWKPPTYLYLGFSIAVATITIGIQQFYIYSRVEANLQFERKEFYRSASYSLLIYGISLLFLCISLIVKGSSTDYQELLNNQAVLFYQLATLFSCLAVIPLTSLVISYLYPSVEGEEKIVSKDGTDREIGNITYKRLTFIVFFIFGEVRLLRQSSLPPWLQYLVIRFFWPLMVILVWLYISALVFEVMVESHILFSSEISVGSSYFLLPFSEYSLPVINWSVYYVWQLIYAIAFAISALAIVTRASELITGEAGTEGYAMFVFFLAIFSLPPVIQYSSIYLTSSVLVALMLLGGVIWLTYLRINNKHLFSNRLLSSYQSRSRFYWWLFFSIIALACVFFLLLCIGLVPSKDGNYPLIFITSSFLTFGCTWMITVDLGTASKSHNLLLGEFLSGLAIKKIGHELHNNLLPLRFFVNDSTLAQILQPDASTISLETMPQQEREGLVEQLGAAKQACSDLIHYSNELKTTGQFATAPPGKYKAIKLIGAFIRKYRHMSEDYDYSLSYNPSLRAKSVDILCNPELLEGVLRIYVDNAVESSVQGRKNEIEIRCSVEQENFVIEISDLGCGMPELVKKRFGQRQKSSKEFGTGIGTAIATGWLQQMSGYASVPESNDNGTKVVIRLPLSTSKKSKERP
ncbi:MAG: HAMP domain-containing sensor histidine kinase [Sedimenticola sp.]